MRLLTLAALTVAAVALVAAPADAASKKRSQSGAQQSVQAQRGEAGVIVRRTRTRITVTRRSYLDAGTEVYPGSQNYTGYIFSPYYLSPAHSILGPGRIAGEPTPGTDPLWNRSYHVPNWGY